MVKFSSIAFVLLAGCGAQVDHPPPPTTLTTGLVAYWKLDGDAKDSSGHNIDLLPAPGKDNGQPSYVQAKFNAGLYPRVSQTTFECPECVALEHPNLPELEMNGDFTISMWAKRSASPVVDGIWWGYALFDNGQVTFGAQGTAANPSPAYPTLYFHDGATVLGQVEDPTFDFRAASNTDVWVHLVAFRRGSTIGIRVNGKETTATVTRPVGVPSTFFLAQNSGGYPWQGVVDEVAKWNRALSSDEMDQLWAHGAGRTL
jgi:hypothetical protein